MEIKRQAIVKMFSSKLKCSYGIIHPNKLYSQNIATYAERRQFGLEILFFYGLEEIVSNT